MKQILFLKDTKQIKNYKKIFFNLSFALFFSFILLSCSNEPNNNKSSKTLDIVVNPDTCWNASYFAFFGDAHNKGLDYIYNNYIVNLLIIPDSINLMNAIYSQSSFFVDSIYPPSIPLNPITINNLPNYNLDSLIGSKFSAITQNIMNEILISINNAVSEQQLLITLDSLDIIIANTVPQNEQSFCWSCNAVAKYSTTYWNSQNGQNWINFLNNLPSKIKKSKSNNIQGTVNWKGVGEADCAAFMAACAFYFQSGVWTKDACIGAICLGLETGGVGAVPGAILGVLGGCAKYGIASAVASSAGVLAWDLIWG